MEVVLRVARECLHRIANCEIQLANGAFLFLRRPFPHLFEAISGPRVALQALDVLLKRDLLGLLGRLVDELFRLRDHLVEKLATVFIALNQLSYLELLLAV